MWKEVAEAIRCHKRFLVTTHIHPEGDAIGAEIALTMFLRNLGKEVTIVNSSPTPINSSFLDPDEEIKVYPQDYEKQMLAEADVVIIVDVNNWSHVGPLSKELAPSKNLRICIDHHQGTEDGFADIIASDTTAAAAGLLIYELIRHMKGEITPRIAEAVYAAIITDTGTFRFSNTTQRVFKAAHELLDKGIEPFEMYKQVFAKTTGSVKLLGYVLCTMDATPDGRVAWIHATQKMFKDSGADYEDSDGLLEVVRGIRGVEFCMFFKELEGGSVKVSLRSNGNVDVYEIAKRHGGGGHRMASGMTVPGPMEQAIRTVSEECAKEELP
jgi:phosphoesterase RecJ-like protein